jgi:hypothetical protein
MCLGFVSSRDRLGRDVLTADSRPSSRQLNITPVFTGEIIDVAMIRNSARWVSTKRGSITMATCHERRVLTSPYTQ